VITPTPGIFSFISLTLYADSGVASALAGLDMVMPDTKYWGNNLTTAINNGSVPESRLNDMATRYVLNPILKPYSN
jgi:beta-glucosidase-like glycosyl hydrolase